MRIIRKIYRRLRYRILPDPGRKRAFRLAKESLLSSGGLTDAEKNLLKNVSTDVHRLDAMYLAPDARHYLSVGLSVIRCIEESLKAAGRTSPICAILDFPSGYGRVLRFLRAKFPDALIVASEIDAASLTFCKKHFSAMTYLSRTDFKELSLSQKFDLIWCGSLATHLDEPKTVQLLSFFRRHLADGGICIFTTHGQLSIKWMREGKETYGLNSEAREKIFSGFGKNGYGYADYKGYHGYGVSVVSYDHMTKLAKKIDAWKAVHHIEHGWDDHQDVYAFMASGV